MKTNKEWGTLHWFDWLIVLLSLVATAWIAIVTQRHVKGVADFLSAGRVAGRYVLCVAGAVGVVSTVWFTIGGSMDLCRLFKDLENKETNVLDDGRVVGHVSADDVVLVEQVEHVSPVEALTRTDIPAQLAALRREQADLLDSLKGTTLNFRWKSTWRASPPWSDWP